MAAIAECASQIESILPGRIFVNGKWQDSSTGRTSPVTNPATKALLGEVAECSDVDVDSAVAAARDAFHGPWSKLSGYQREKVLHRIADVFDKHADELALLQTIEMGKPITQSRTYEIPFCSDWLRSYAGWASKCEGSTKPVAGDLLAYTQREPVGVVAAITPFNFPIALTITKLAPALASGNVFIHKPASITPLSALKLAKIMEEADLPPGVFQLLTGPGKSIGDAISHHPGIDKVAFTGSTDIGRHIVRESAETLKHVTMELGGKSPNIVFADADLEAASRFAYFGTFRNLGQLCTAGTRLLIEKPVYRDVIDRLIKLVDSSPIGAPLDPDTFFGPAASEEQFRKITEYMEIGKAEGASVAWGGHLLEHLGGYFLEPTLFADANNSMRIAREEIFGPVLAIIPFDGVEEAIAIANDSPFGLNAGVHTRDIPKALRVANALSAGTVHINSYDDWDVAAPFGGYKQSGYGRESGREVLESYTQTKTIWINTQSHI